MGSMKLVSISMAVFATAAIVLLLFYYLDIFLMISILLGISVIIVIIATIVLFTLISLIAIPYYWMTRKPEVQEFGDYSIDDIKGKNE